MGPHEACAENHDERGGQEPVRHRALMHKQAIEYAREQDGDRVVKRLLHRDRQVQVEGPVRQQHEKHQPQPLDARSHQQQAAKQREGNRRNVEQQRRPHAPAHRFADQAIQRDEPGAPGIEMRERGGRRLFANRVVTAREADRRKRLDLVPVHDGVRHDGMKDGEASPQIDGHHPRETQGWQEQNQADQSGSNQPLFPGEQSIEHTNPLHTRWRPCDQGQTDVREPAQETRNRSAPAHQRWRPCDQGQTDGHEPAQETKDRQVFQARGYAGVPQRRRRRLDPKRLPVNLVGILNGGIADEVADVLERTVRQRVAEGPIPLRIGPRKRVPLLQLETGGVIDGRGPADIDLHGAIPVRQPQNRIRRPRQRPAHQPRHHQARGQTRREESAGVSAFPEKRQDAQVPRSCCPDAGISSATAIGVVPSTAPAQ